MIIIYVVLTCIQDASLLWSVCGKGSSKVKMTITRGLLFPSCVPRPKELLAVAAPALA